MLEVTRDDIPNMRRLGMLITLVLGLAKTAAIMIGLGLVHAEAPAVPALGFYVTLILFLIWTFVRRFKFQIVIERVVE